MRIVDSYQPLWTLRKHTVTFKIHELKLGQVWQTCFLINSLIDMFHCLFWRLFDSFMIQKLKRVDHDAQITNAARFFCDHDKNQAINQMMYCNRKVVMVMSLIKQILINPQSIELHVTAWFRKKEKVFTVTRQGQNKSYSHIPCKIS